MNRDKTETATAAAAKKNLGNQDARRNERHLTGVRRACDVSTNSPDVNIAILSSIDVVVANVTRVHPTQFANKKLQVNIFILFLLLY